jgi:hypothetical protein
LALAASAVSLAFSNILVLLSCRAIAAAQGTISRQWVMLAHELLSVVYLTKQLNTHSCVWNSKGKQCMLYYVLYVMLCVETADDTNTL